MDIAIWKLTKLEIMAKKAKQLTRHTFVHLKFSIEIV